MPDGDRAFDATAAALRPPHEVMRLARMGAAFPTRLSLMRILVRRMARERWSLERVARDFDAEGAGTAVWRISTPGGVLSFVAFSSPLRPEERTDRVIAEKWDMTAALCRGAVSDEDIGHLRSNAPRQEAGRYTSRDLVLTRANRSARLFDGVVEALRRGAQPDWRPILSTGYLMRTTAVYGNGKFGLADHPCTAENPSVSGGFIAEMLAVYMVRAFQIDLVEHLARGSPGGLALDRERARALGIGNATGLGMAPFLVRHPALLAAWVETREQALALMLARPKAGAPERARFAALLARSLAHVKQWAVDDAAAMARIEALRSELATLAAREPAVDWPWRSLFDQVCTWASADTQEFVAALLLEIGGADVDALEGGMLAGREAVLPAGATLGWLKAAISRDYAFALALDPADPSHRRFFWYYSANKEEPRLGRRFEESGADVEMPVGTAMEVAALWRRLCELDEAALDDGVAGFLLREPQWRRAARRAMTTAALPYSDVRDNLIGDGMRPVDLLRFKLSVFGASRFDPKSDLWTRVTMFQGAPLPDDLGGPDADDWWLPALGPAS
jgi:hypothetical protein